MTRTTPPTAPETGFAALGLDPRILSALTALGHEEPTPVQVAAIPPLLAGHDVLGQAATGTGKTAAFALPLLHCLTPSASPVERTAALVLVPTRELAIQVAEAIHRYGRELGVISLPIYGGAAMETQLRALARGVDVVVATPGRALDHIRRKTLHLASVKLVVLDEADEMLDMGFAEELEAILAATPSTRQTALFAATMPARIAEIAKQHLRSPVRVRIDREVLRRQRPARAPGRVHRPARAQARRPRAHPRHRASDLDQAEFDVMDIAAAAVKQAHQREGNTDETEIPAVTPAAFPKSLRQPPARNRPVRGRPGATGPAPGVRRARIEADWNVTRLYIGAGRRAGKRPADLVGAIANEVGVDARAIGAIQIADSHSIVEVPEAIADEVVVALRLTRLQGKRVLVRRDSERPPPGAGRG